METANDSVGPPISNIGWAMAYSVPSPMDGNLRSIFSKCRPNEMSIGRDIDVTKFEK